MSIPIIPGVANFLLTPAPAGGGTAFAAVIPPYRGLRGPLLYGVANNSPNWLSQYLTHVTSILYDTTDTNVHSLYVMRPLNYSTITTAVAKNATTVILADDPGVYSTNYRYPLPGVPYLPPGTANPSGSAPTTVADAAISSTNKWVAYQLDDGTWVVDTVASGTYAALVLTTGTPNRNGGTIAAGRPLFYFGVHTLSNPATGVAHTKFVTKASTYREQQLGAYSGESIPALNPGDPLIFLSLNNTTATTMALVAGDYRRF